MKLSISEILEKTDKARGKNKKIEILHQYGLALHNVTLFQLLRLFFEAHAWSLPPGTCPYKPNQHLDQQGQLYLKFKMIERYFLKDSSPDMNSIKREAVYIQFLESLDKDDAILIESIRNGLMPHESITFELIQEAFPGLIQVDATTE